MVTIQLQTTLVSVLKKWFNQISFFFKIIRKGTVNRRKKIKEEMMTSKIIKCCLLSTISGWIWFLAITPLSILDYSTFSFFIGLQL